MRARRNSELGCAGQLSQSLRTYVDTNSDALDLHRAAFYWRPHRLSQGQQQDLAHHLDLVCGHFDLMQHQSHSRAARGGLCHALPLHLFLVSRDEKQKVHALRPDVRRHVDLSRFAKRADALSAAVERGSVTRSNLVMANAWEQTRSVQIPKTSLRIADPRSAFFIS